MTGAWTLAARNLRRHLRRNLVTGLAIALGYAGLVILGGYALRIERLLRAGSVYGQHRGHVAVYAPGGLRGAEAKPSAYALPPEAQEAIAAALRADPRVELTGRYLAGGGIAGNGCQSFPFRAVGVEPDVERRDATHPELAALGGGEVRPRAGRFLFDVPGEESPVVLAPRLATYVGKRAAASGERTGPPPEGALDCAAADLPRRIAADPIVQLGARTQDGSFGALEVRAVGLYAPATTEEDKTGLVAPLDLLQRLYDTDRVAWVAAYLRDHRDAPAVAADVRARLAAVGLQVDVYRYDDKVANPYLAGTMGFLGGLVLFIGLLVANVVAFSVLNAMTLAVLERTRELGTLRSLGFTRRQVSGLFLREAALLTAVAVAAGLALALAAAAVVRAADVRFEPPGMGGEIQLLFSPTPGLCAGAALLFLGLSLAATFVAVRRTTRARVAALIAEVAA
ncbi:MAG TPA: FtsX-like permease family protein [Anaeromyxobacteraceae bacterium]|nr:FtsX-like permease family protein [Anaeromyxobacteraceae bacterium]